MKKLNSNQIRFLLTHWFGLSDLCKIFETCDLDWLCKQMIRIDDRNNGWVDVYLDDRQYTSIRISGKCSAWYDELLKIK